MAPDSPPIIASPLHIILPPFAHSHALFVAPCTGWFAIPGPEIFSRHAGTCLLLGDRAGITRPQRLKLGDCIRLGDVASTLFNGSESDVELAPLAAHILLQQKHDRLRALHLPAINASISASGEVPVESVSEDGKPARYVMSTASKLLAREFLKAECLDKNKDSGVDAPLCYICYDGDYCADNPLVAPCQCRGDTQYAHVYCLKTWYRTSPLCRPRSRVRLKHKTNSEICSSMAKASSP